MPAPLGAMAESLSRREGLTNKLKDDSYSIDLRMQLVKEYEFLGYPDLAIMDAYKALLLLDEVQDDGCEYHESALESIRDYMRLTISSAAKVLASDNGGDAAQDSKSARAEEELPSQKYCAQYVENTWRKDILLSISKNLTDIGCLRPAYEYVKQILRLDPTSLEALSAMEKIHLQFRSSTSDSDLDQDQVQFTASTLPDRGHVRREVYPWNHHETDRHSAKALQLLNHEMRQVAPKLEVKVTELPFLASGKGEKQEPSPTTMIKQLGVFAKEYISAGETILTERSLLTGNSRLHEPLCDACSSLLPTLVDAHDSKRLNGKKSQSLIPCSDCDDVIFCSEECHDLAQAQYHPAVCGMDVDTIAKDVAPSKAADSLYTLLLFRALAMAQTQGVHPLDLGEVKYIWGDFTSSDPSSDDEDGNPFSSAPRALPFSFDDNILTPLHMLEMMEVNIFDTAHELSELWVWNTLYAKFRGTASARISPRDGRPEVAAVHPLWCLANHSCDPNVRWEWAGEIKFTARETRIAWSKSGDNGTASERQAPQEGGINQGEEILNHYVDIDLPVQDRREWGVGALGGFCRCARCVWESSHD